MENSTNMDPYAVVLADLRAKQLQIEQAIAAIEALQGGTSGLSVGKVVTGGRSIDSARPVPENGALLGLSIAEAAKKILQTRRAKMTTPEIVAALESGGVVLTSADKNNTVGSLLLRRFYMTGDIVRVNRGVWGLQEWYPGRKFAKGNKVGEEKESTEPKEFSATEAEEQEESNFDLRDLAPQPDLENDNDDDAAW